MTKMCTAVLFLFKKFIKKSRCVIIISLKNMII